MDRNSGAEDDQGRPTTDPSELTSDADEERDAREHQDQTGEPPRDALGNGDGAS